MKTYHRTAGFLTAQPPTHRRLRPPATRPPGRAVAQM